MTEKPRGWANLPPELLRLILQNLTSVDDYNKCRHVCRAWRTAIDDAIEAKKKFLISLNYRACSLSFNPGMFDQTPK